MPYTVLLLLVSVGNSRPDGTISEVQILFFMCAVAFQYSKENGIKFLKNLIHWSELFLPFPEQHRDSQQTTYRYECSRNIQVVGALEDTENVKGSEKLVFNALIFGALTMSIVRYRIC